MTINTTSTNLPASSNQYESKIEQLKAQILSYEAQLQKETDTKKQQEIEAKIQKLEEQISTYQAKETSNNNTASSTESKSSNTNPIDTVEISPQGNALSEQLKLLRENQATLKEDSRKDEKEGSLNGKDKAE